MPSHILRNRSYLLAGTALLAGVLLLFYFDPFQWNDSSRLKSAQNRLAAWDVRGAEELLQPLAQTPGKDRAADSVYAEVLFLRGELPLASSTLSRLLSKVSPTNLRFLYLSAHTHYFLGQMDSALAETRLLEQEATTQNDTLSLMRSAYLMGRIDFNRGSFTTAREHQSKSLSYARSIGSTSGKADALRQLGVLAWYGGRLDSALNAFYQPALELYRQVGDRIGEATTLSNMGLIAESKGDWETNLRFQLEALAIRTAIGDQIGLADSYYFANHLPATLRSGGEAGYDYLLRSLELSKRIGYAWGADVAMRALLDHYVVTLKIPQRISELIDTSLMGRSAEGEIFLRFVQIRAMPDTGSLAQRLALHRIVIRMCDSIGYVSQKIAARVGYANDLIISGQYQEAERSLRLARREAGEDEWRKGFAEEVLAGLLLRTGRYNEAVALLEPKARAYDDLFLSRLRTSGDEASLEAAASFVHRNRQMVYRVLVKALAPTGGEKFFSVLERERILPFWGERGRVTGNAPTDKEVSPAQQLFRAYVRKLDALERSGGERGRLEDLRRLVGELNKALLIRREAFLHSSEHVSMPSVVRLRDLQQVLAPGEVVVEYSVGWESVYAMVIRQAGTHVVSLPITEPDLRTLIDVYRRSVLRGRDDPSDKIWEGPSLRMHRALIKPLEDQGLMHAGDRLCFIPQGMLHQVPFHALRTANEHGGTQIVLEKYVVSYAPSATFLYDMRTKLRAPMLRAFAATPHDLSLPYSVKEVEGLKLIPMNGTTILSGHDATTSELVTHMSGSDIIHIASHARMNPSFPLFSSITFSDRDLELHEILRSKVQANLVVLSACESGLGIGMFDDVPSGEDVVSFPRAFLTAGAANVIASSWMVDDATAAELMSAFYRFLSENWSDGRPDISGAFALAQRELLMKARSATGNNHPFYWGSFFVAGAN